MDTLEMAGAEYGFMPKSCACSACRTCRNRFVQDGLIAGFEIGYRKFFCDKFQEKPFEVMLDEAECPEYSADPAIFTE